MTMEVSISPPWKSQILPSEMVAVTSGWLKAPDERMKGEMPNSLRSSLLKTCTIGAFPPWHTRKASFLKPWCTRLVLISYSIW